MTDALLAFADKHGLAAVVAIGIGYLVRQGFADVVKAIDRSAAAARQLEVKVEGKLDRLGDKIDNVADDVGELRTIASLPMNRRASTAGPNGAGA